MSKAVMRPPIPPLAWWCAGLWMGIALAELHAWQRLAEGSVCSRTGGVLALAGALVVGVFVLVRARRGARQSIAMLLLAAGLLGFGLGGARWSAWHEAQSVVTKERYLAGTVVRDAVAGRLGTQLLVELDDAAGATVRVMLPEGVEPPRPAARVEIRGSPRPPVPEDEWARRAHRRGEIASIQRGTVTDLGWSSSLRGRLAPVRERVRALCAEVGGPGGDVLQGVLIGDRSRVRGTILEDDLRICGLSHLLAVSGTHLGILALAAGNLVRFARGGVLARMVCLCGVGLAYVVVSGVQTSAVRALVMGGVAGVASVSGRRGDALSALAVACGSMLVMEPAVAFDVGFQLSVSAVGGLVAFGPLVANWIECACGRRGRSIVRMVAATLVAQAATAPVAVPTFGMFSLVAPLANVLAVPLLTVGLGLGVLGSSIGLLLEGAGVLVLRLASMPLHLTGVVAGWCARLPGAALGLRWDGGVVATLMVGVAVAVWWGWPLPRGRRSAAGLSFAAVAICAVVMVGLPVLPGDASLIVLDVGQGDAILLRDGAAAVLVDTGADPGVLRTALTRHGVRTLDAVVLTHDHADHTAGLAGLVGLCRVERVLVPAVADEESFSSCVATMGRLGLAPQGDPVRGGDAFHVGRTRITVVWPSGPSRRLSTNDTSMVLLVERDGFSAILTGDAEETALTGVLEHMGSRRVDVLKVPHHGSSNGLTREALEVWRPRVALVSVGEGNDHGHPDPSVMDMLTRSGAWVLRTDRVGDIVIRLTSNGYHVQRSHTMTPDVACGTIAHTGSRISARRHLGHTGPEDHGSHATHRPQTRLPHLRPRGPPSRPGGRAAEKAAGGRCGP